MKLIPFLALVATAAPAQAALSGFYDSAAQIAAIMADAQVADALAQAPIEQITRTRTYPDGRQDWRLRTQRCAATVQIQPRRNASIGPVRWTIRSIGRCVDTSDPIR